MAIDFNKIQPMKLVFDNVSVNMKNRKSKPELPTGIDALDDIIWGIHKGELTVIGGRPGQCKTSLALNMAWNLCDMRKKVLFLSLEMSREQLTERLFTKMTGLSSHDLRRGLCEEKELQSNIELFSSMVKDSTMLVTDGMGFVFDEVEELITSLEPQFEVLFIDHLQMISCKGHFKKLDAMEEYVRKLKELAEKYHIAIVALSQVNRSVGEHKNHRPRIEMLKSCGAIEEVADTVLLNYWPYKNDPNEEDKNRFEIMVEKQRHGDVGIAHVHVEPELYNFKRWYGNS